jgi:ABC-type Zn uptake system ZnuABC Zn-binding protein ZnuA
LLALILGLSVSLGAACGGGANDEGRLRAVTSLEIFADMVRNVGGDRVEVEALLPSGADPHTYELAPGRVADIVRADAVFLNGLGLEESIEGIVRTNAEGEVVELADELPTLEDGNPHLWLDPRLGARYVERIQDALIAVDPAGGAAYESNAGAYLEELAALDREFEAAVESIPAAERKLVTFHDAFPYLAARYGLEVVAVVAPSPGQEPSARAVADLVHAIRDSGVAAVFKEPQFSSDILDRAADEADVRVLDLLSDAYIEGVDSYLGLMRFNLAQLREGLGGD